MNETIYIIVQSTETTMLNDKQKKLLENYLYKRLKKELFEEISEKNNSGYTEQPKGSAGISDRKGTGGDSKDANRKANAKLKQILPVLNNTYDDSVQTYNIERSQLSYELWPELPRDTARSKLSQKINGRKNFTPREINKISNIISGDIA